MFNKFADLAKSILSIMSPERALVLWRRACFSKISRKFQDWRSSWLTSILCNDDINLHVGSPTMQNFTREGERDANNEKQSFGYMIQSNVIVIQNETILGKHHVWDPSSSNLPKNNNLSSDSFNPSLVELNSWINRTTTEVLDVNWNHND